MALLTERTRATWAQSLSHYQARAAELVGRLTAQRTSLDGVKTRVDALVEEGTLVKEDADYMTTSVAMAARAVTVLRGAPPTDADTERQAMVLDALSTVAEILVLCSDLAVLQGQLGTLSTAIQADDAASKPGDIDDVTAVASKITTDLEDAVAVEAVL